MAHSRFWQKKELQEGWLFYFFYLSLDIFTAVTENRCLLERDAV
jgi:hypothetical protein